MRSSAVILLGCLPLLVAAVASREANRFVPLDRAGPPISAGAIVPAGSETFFVSGIPGDAALGGTEAQTQGVLVKVSALLRQQGYALGDIVNVKVYLVGDPALGGRMDFAGMNRAFAKAMGVDHRPSRTTVQVAGLASAGSLIEIEAIAARSGR